MPDQTIKPLDETTAASPDIVAENIAKLRELFPECFTEGSDEDGPRFKVDFDALKETLGEYVEDKEERYSFTWNGKSRARRIAQTPSTGTLRPCPDESVNWDTTKNLFIEGDNLEVLKLLQKSYHRKVKMIYIDPPYNTGNEFIYPDKFQDNLDTYLRYTGQIDDDGFRLGANSDSSGRYHTNWLNMMYPRLKLARNLLADDGAIVISIDDHEISNLRDLCDEVFGEENFIATVIWQKVFSPKNTAAYFSEDHDYLLIYARHKPDWSPTLLPRSEDNLSRYTNPDNDPRGDWMSGAIQARNYYSKGQYEVTSPSGNKFRNPRGTYWRFSEERFKELDADNRIWWGEDGGNVPRLKRFLSEVKQGVVPQTLWQYQDVGHTQEAKEELLKYVEFENSENVFNSVKPTRLLRKCLKIGTVADSEDIVLDFFAGSAPLGHAVMAQNEEDGGNRRYILVQLPEPLPTPEPKLTTIADLGRSRLASVIREITKARKESLPRDPDDMASQELGFRTLKLSSSNIKAWDADFERLEDAVYDATDSVKADRSQGDLLNELLLKFGLDLCVPIEKRQIENKAVYSVGAGALIVCLDQAITLEVVEGIAALKEELQPEVMRVVFRDSGFKDDVVKTNAVQILKQAGLSDEHIRSI